VCDVCVCVGVFASQLYMCLFSALCNTPCRFRKFCAGPCVFVIAARARERVLPALRAAGSECHRLSRALLQRARGVGGVSVVAERPPASTVLSETAGAAA
jgi:hypothetical protein